MLPILLFAETSISTESEILESAHTPLTTLYGAPETNILGVNVINGDYSYSCIDFDLPGSDPLIFQRTYCSSQNRLKSFFHGWSHNLSSSAKTYSLSENLHVILSGSLSGEIPFRTEIDNRHEVLKINRDIFKKGITNSAKGQISGRMNVKNMRVKYSGIGITVINPDGTEHRHRKDIYRTEQPEYYSENRLVETIKPNGMKTTYDSMTLLTNNVQSLTHNNVTSNQIKFNCPNYREILSKRKLKEADFSVTGSSDDGKTAKYTFNSRKKLVRLRDHGKKEGFIISMSAFESSHFPSESYRYMDRDDGHDILTERTGEHHKTTIDYYNRGDKVVMINGESEEISPSHIARNRVKKISVAVNNSEDIQPLRHFAYHKDKESKDAFTDVYNNEQHLTRFHYSTKNYRLNCVEKYEGNATYSVYRRDRLQYGTKLTPLEGDLLFKTIESSDGTVHLGENFDYDERGNVLKRKLHYRRFTDFKSHSISAKENPFSKGNHRLKGGEIKATTYTYNQLNLPTSEDDGKLKTFLTYHERNGKETNLLESKLIQTNQNIKKREFYEFDGNAGCTLKIEDDGITNTSKDLTGVKHRKTTHYINRKGRFAGLPLEIDVWGSNGQEEKRICRTVLEYDSHGHVEKEFYYNANNEFAYLIHKVRDLQGNITCEIDPLGQTTHREYNAYGSLKEEQGPSLEYKMEYQYDWLQRPIEETRKCSDGIHLTTSRKYDLEGRLTKITDPYGFQTQLIYNEQGRPTEIVYPPVRTEDGNWVGPREFKQYNFLGHLISETDAKGAVTVYTPNDAGMPLKITHADGTFEQFVYSIYGETLEKIQRNGSKVVYAYDDLSRLTSETIYDHDGQILKRCSKKYSGLLLLSETDGEGLTKKYIYDYAGRVSEVSQGKALTKYIYDLLGRVEEEQRYFGDSENDYIATQFKYDLLNRVISKKEVDAKGQTHSKIVTTYDCVGNVESTTTKTHAGIAISFHQYDARGNLSSTTDPLGNKTHYIQRYDFFFEGQNLPCLEVIDPAGVKTTTISDSSGAVMITQVHSPFGKLLSETEMFYDLQGNLTRKEQHLPSETIVTLYEYDSCSRLIQQVNGAGTSEQITTNFVYNSFGELSETHYCDGTSKHRTYDRLGRLFEEWSNDKTIHYEYTYNRQDLPTHVKNLITKKETIRKYTREGNLITEYFENGLKITYCYDRINRLIECIYPDGSSVKQTYNPVFLTKTERLKEDAVIYTSTFQEFDQAGKPKNIAFPKKSGRLSLRYDLLSRPTSLFYPCYKEKEICYDKRGLLTSKIVNDDLQTFDHDYLKQLTLEKSEKYSHTYENDALHRQTSVDGFAQTHNALHQLTKGIHEEYKYDAKGRRVKDSTTQFIYDKFDRLITAKKGDSTWEYSYDAFNRKMTRTSSGETTRYFYNGHEDIGSYHNKKCVDLKILSSTEGSLPIAIELSDQQYAPLISPHGHIVGLVEIETGNLADQSFLTLFGKDLCDKPLSPWRFCGKRHEEAALGIIDFGFRFYHPKSAQWLTQDPLGESSGPNLYTYVNNNPGCCVDRFGLFMDDFSFSSAWESFKETCSNAWESVRDSFSWGESQTDYNVQARFDGATRTIGGGYEFAAGAALMASGCGLIPGIFLCVHAVDNGAAGCSQAITGQKYDPFTVQLLEKFGMSNWAASFTNDVMCVAGACKGSERLLSGTQMGPSLSSTMSAEASLANKFVLNQTSSEKVLKVRDMINSWLGEGAQAMKNKAGDLVFLSKDGAKKVRFDINRPAPHTNPHGHVEELINGNWNKSGPIYPTDVPHY